MPFQSNRRAGRVAARTRPDAAAAGRLADRPAPRDRLYTQPWETTWAVAPGAPWAERWGHGPGMAWT